MDEKHGAGDQNQSDHTELYTKQCKERRSVSYLFHLTVFY